MTVEPNLELMSRAGCGLCEEAKSTLRALGIPFEEFDVDDDPHLHLAYGSRVPVLLRDGEVVGEGRLHAAAVLRTLAGRGD